ncbi:DUF3299 domain-containing protein [Falsihalocynthiibacter arcticus]|uniref:Lipoprotein n=1 Tax=Falsihalocynthiibacter arcticus TaxID=1579316 RepID=A0A126V299_9RHOB|nr:DUF3299 domain-containing protein [Falsihalocynthiibacter arcticus]AML51809.1 hypothetical protein RC74_11515 [Falsihalocynthiibacter arcticus]
MVNRHLQRRALLAGMAAATLVPSMASAEEYIDLDWEDLLPEDQPTIPSALLSSRAHDERAPLTSKQPESNGVRTEWNGQIVRLPGFIVPIDYTGTGVTAFILVPYVGACVHVPPPPANQLVFVTTPTPYESSDLFEPVNVIGMFGVSSLSTHLAEIGYALSADKIEPYR